MTAICGADESQPGAERIEPGRIPLWNGRAPIGDGEFQDAEAWITVHRPAKGDGAAIVICPGGGYGTLVTGASNEKQVTARTPPTFLAHAQDDKVVPPQHSQASYEALQAQRLQRSTSKCRQVVTA